ncbi:biotin transporter BioY [Sphingobium sp. 22B]|uniref:molybdopterin-dependent oxidoreductase n=1 Tax=unclassified Sphingobium TaxID=2611147 RepID=UPI000781DED4|nr:MULTISPECIES: molybdopterin-dependent oxidoreductase [unclassified Sphingobium]KXU33852.1 biotin transporter BioY [Sphingobium sp. AM]KYC33797.1 biotin transporter BioY [Sphingobium sp. 22B]OAP33531.1 biotin transporter BioY [Sphingobium sp. 20006FA]
MTRYSAAHWGVYEVSPGDRDAAPRLAPLGSDPDPNPIGLDQLEEGMARLRVLRPAIRKGWLEKRAREGRGEEAFVEVPWDEALDIVAAEIARVRRDHGNEAIFGGSYGWASAGRFHHAQSQLHRFYNMLGGYVRSVDSYSLGAGRVLMPHIAASMDESNASHTSWDVLEAHCELFVSFGGVPLKNTRVSSSGAGRHRARDGLRRLREAGARIVNIGPVGDNLGDGDAEEWIAVRPNTDAAMMLALAWVVLHDPLFDRSFLDSHTVGFDRFRAYLTGEADGTPKTPAWAAAITGVPAGRIAALGQDLLRHRTMLNCAWALQRAAHGEQPFWALVTLAAMVGQIGLPGGGYGLGYGAMNVMGSAHPRLPGPVFPQGTNGVSAFIPCARIADMLLHPGERFTYNGGVHRYPDIRLVHWAGGNPFHHHQDLNRLRQAWARPETIIVQEPYWTPVARQADIVLPATISLERDDIGFATREGFFVAMRQAVPPQGEARDDHAIFAALAGRLGVGAAFTEGLDMMGWLRRIYAESAGKIAATGINLPDFDHFWEEGIIDLSAHDKPHVMHADFRRDPLAHPLATPSGKIEIYSEKIAGFGLDDCPGHAVWREPFEWLGHEKAARYPLHLLSDQPERRLHSQLDASAYSRAGKVAGREPVYLNPVDAAARGIADGAVVELFNDRGRCLAGAILSDAIMPGVARLATGAWFDPGPGLERHGNPNVLTLDRGASGLSQGCVAQTCLIEARLFEGAPPRVAIFDPPQVLPRNVSP